MSGELVRYNAMCHAIAVCHSVDEVKDLKDKAYALELYAKQTKNTDAERKACEIRLRAERRTGELLKELARNQTAGLRRGPSPNDAETVMAGLDVKFTQGPITRERSPYADALHRTGISTQTASRYQALAEVPAATFEAALREPEKPTTTGLLAKAEAARAVQEARDPTPKMPADALWLWGRMRDLERECYFSKSPESLLSPLTETMLADMRRILPLCVDFINQLAEHVHEPA